THSRVGSCLANDWGSAPAGVVVERTGVQGESVTFLNTSGRQILGCDYAGGHGDDDRPWCGLAAGQLHAGRLRDPRLDLGWSTGGRNRLGFVWVQPARTTRFVVVQPPGFAEVYEIAGGFPIRVTTSDVNVDSLRASVAVSEYSREGKLIRQYGMT